MRPVDAGPVARLYVCGITPYDATHLGHAATYVTFDLVGRALRDAGHRVHYVQNVTDVDDPLLERAARDGRDWRELATAEIDLFREDMTALAVVPPDALVGVVESMPEITREVRTLLADGAAYRVPVPDGESAGEDIYLDLVAGAELRFGVRLVAATRWRPSSPTAAATRSAPASATPSTRCCGGRPATANPVGTTSVLGAGRPGWHIECTAISLDRLGHPLDIQGGGTDLVFPHHEMSAVQSAALTHDDTFAGTTCTRRWSATRARR